ncbi:MAG: helix-turn-helix transcriptional regulator [Deltaproteobacteria bacterium]|nr:helix-turn-helix transcriptional regulator [Deltaproteobacteria bacterium]
MQILSTKLYAPPYRPEAILRPLLIEQMNKGLHRKLTLISAPAGFGKTTLVSQWAANSKRPVAWLSVDEGENDPVRFLVYLISAMQTIVAKIGEGALDMLQSPQPPPTEAILTVLLNEFTTIPDNCILVLDDYHVIDAQPVDNALTFLLDYLPQQFHLVIATREDPGFPLARLRARGQLTELRATDLRFTPSEAAEFLNRVMELNLSAENITALETRTEGWIAGLQLAAISMKGHKDVSNFIKSFAGSHHFVMDYLVEEVLQQQPENVQNFLLRTSILDRMCSSLCAAVMLDSSASGQEILEYIENTNLFIIPLDNERCWYRYHHLFADLLRQRLLQSSSSADGEGRVIAECHLRASVWYEDHDHRIEAIHHAVAARDLERVAGLVELAWPAMERSFQTTAWLGLVKSLPDEMVRCRPVLCAGYGLALMSNGQYEAGETRLKEAERWIDATVNMGGQQDIQLSEMIVVDKEQFQSLPASIATARIYHAQAFGDLSGAVKFSQQALELLPEEDLVRRGVAAGLLACSYWANGDLEEAYQTFINVKAGHETVGSSFFASAITIGLADIRVAQGRLLDAARLFEDTIQRAFQQDESLVAVIADLYLGWSMIKLEQNDLEAAKLHLVKSRELGDKAELTDWRYRWYIAQARIEEALGNLDKSLDLFHESERLFLRTARPDLRPIAALKARVWIVQGRLSDARNWVQEQRLSVNDDLSYLHEFEHITLARILMAGFSNNQIENAISEAMGLLERLLKAAEKGGRIGSMIEILLLQALAYETLDNISSASVPLEHALALAEPEGYIRIFTNEGVPMARLLSNTASKGIMTDYIGKLLAVNEVPSSSSSTAGNLVEPLSQREQEVLQLVARGFSNREISERLYLALTTVKGHNSNIFGKLQVKSRTEAIVRARELGLIS